jgi:hypothetical protein
LPGCNPRLREGNDIQLEQKVCLWHSVFAASNDRRILALSLESQIGKDEILLRYSFLRPVLPSWCWPF